MKGLNLRGHDNHSCIMMTWIDQRNTLDHLHTLGKKMFERALDFFFDDHKGCYVLDDELIGYREQGRH
jgi:hypothetical protein